MNHLKTRIFLAGLPFLYMLAGCSSYYARGTGQAEIGSPEQATFNASKTSNGYPERGQKETWMPAAFEGDFFRGVSGSDSYLGREFSEFWMQFENVKKAFPTDVNQCFYYIAI